MPCEWLKDEKTGAVIHINRRRRPLGKMFKCKFCQRNYREGDGKLCDFPVGEDKTCDAQMCSDCATTIGPQNTPYGEGTSLVRLGDTFDVCPIHRGMEIPKEGVR